MRCQVQRAVEQLAGTRLRALLRSPEDSGLGFLIIFSNGATNRLRYMPNCYRSVLQSPCTPCVIIFSMSLSYWYTPADSYFYSRPISYHSYRGRIFKTDLLASTFNTDHVNKIKALLRKFNVTWTESDSLSRNLRFDDFEIGRRRFDHYHTLDHEAEWYLHQWKSTNDLSVEHPTGTHEVYRSFEDLYRDLERILVERSRTKV